MQWFPECHTRRLFHSKKALSAYGLIDITLQNADGFATSPASRPTKGAHRSDQFIRVIFRFGSLTPLPARSVHCWERHMKQKPTVRVHPSSLAAPLSALSLSTFRCLTPSPVLCVYRRRRRCRRPFCHKCVTGTIFAILDHRQFRGRNFNKKCSPSVFR